MTYKTKHKDEILSFLKENASYHKTIDEIYQSLNAQGKDISLATLYRTLDFMVNEGIIRKYQIDNSAKPCYLYVDSADCKTHFHMVCEKCGKLIHLQCGEIDAFVNHISQEHGFEIDVSRVVFYGICKECQNEL